VVMFETAHARIVLGARAGAPMGAAGVMY
jgi:hypothetical protein